MLSLLLDLQVQAPLFRRQGVCCFIFSFIVGTHYYSCLTIQLLCSSLNSIRIAPNLCPVLGIIILTSYRLIIILRPGPLGANYQDLYEVEKSDNPTTQTIIDDTKETFKHAQEDVFFKDVKLKFMRIEKWER